LTTSKPSRGDPAHREGGSDIDDYARHHRHRANLLIHIVAVPLFLLSNLALVLAVFLPGTYLWWAVGVMLAVYSLLMQRRGHALEALPQPAAGSAAAALRRFLREQYVTFPRFVLGGGWWRSLRRASSGRRGRRWPR
jgi:hypothetical protein